MVDTNDQSQGLTWIQKSCRRASDRATLPGGHLRSNRSHSYRRSLSEVVIKHFLPGVSPAPANNNPRLGH